MGNNKKLLLLCLLGLGWLNVNGGVVAAGGNEGVTIKPILGLTPEQQEKIQKENSEIQAQRSASGANKNDKSHSWCGTKEELKSENVVDLGVKRAREIAYNFPPNSDCRGYTLCDIPEVVKSYQSQLPDLPTIELNYYVFNLDVIGGGDPLISDSNMNFQHTLMNEKFASSKIGWKGFEITVNNTSLRNMVTIAGCDRNWIADGECDDNCNYYETGFDGGDCASDLNDWKNLCLYGSGRTHSNLASCKSGDCESSGYICEPFSCTPDNGECEESCNIYTSSVGTRWDGGDCCPGPTCRDPSKADRVYRSDSEMKQAILGAASYSINNPPKGLLIYVTKIPVQSRLLGFATFPYDKNALNGNGGSMFRIEAWGNFPSSGLTGITALHELGHNMGLYHVFTGNTEIDSCLSACYEGTLSSSTMSNGDLCEDTAASPVIYGNCQLCKCSGSCDHCDTCGNNAFQSAPATNYMNYGYDSCLNVFTGNQRGRMRCYADLAYGSWRINNAKDTPSRIIMTPTASSEGNGMQINLAWMEPFYLSPSVIYLVTRSPNFSDGLPKNVTETHYEDLEVVGGTKYTYYVEAFGANDKSDGKSPASNIVDPNDEPLAGTNNFPVTLVWGALASLLIAVFLNV